MLEKLKRTTNNNQPGGRRRAGVEMGDIEKLKRKSIFMTKEIAASNIVNNNTMKVETGKFITKLDLLRKKHGKEKLKLNLIN
jgi:hypothetical protein